MKADKWTQQLHDKLAEHETPAPADLWADIEAALPQQPRRSRFVALRRWAVAASVAVLLGGGAMVWWGKPLQPLQPLQTPQTLQTLQTPQPLQTLPQPLPVGRGVDRHSNELSYVEDNQNRPLPSSGGAMGGVLSASASEGQAAALPAPVRGGAGGGVLTASVSEGQAAVEKLQTPPPTPPLEGEGGTAENSPLKSEDGTADNPLFDVRGEVVTKESVAELTTPLDGKEVAAPKESVAELTTPLEGSGKATGRRPSVGNVATPKESLAELTTPLPHREGQGEGLQGILLGLYAMNDFGSQESSNAVQMADALVNSYAGTYAASQAASRQAPVYLAGYEERQHHQQPVAFGLTLSYPLTDWISLTSGIVYTRLKSEFVQVIRSQQINREQKLRYVGIPFSVNYRLWQYKNMNFYLSSGVQADWNVKAQQKTEGVEQEMDKDRLQWSVGGSLCLQYNVLPQLSLYAEPGINHYFDNGSKVQNFFKDKPTSLKLQLGIRLNLK